MTFRDCEIEYYFERRRYGRAQFFVWLKYRVNGGDWQTYGDPWPKSRLAKAELITALADIRKQHVRQEKMRWPSTG